MSQIGGDALPEDVRAQSEVPPCAADVRHAEREEYAEFRGVACSEVEDMCKDFWREEVNRMRGTIRIGPDRSHPVAARQGSDGVVR